MKLRNNSRGLVVLGMGGFVMGILNLAFADTSQQSATPIELPSDPYSFQPGTGSTIASGFCGICHSAEYVYMQPPHPKATWEKIVHKMKSAFGCPIPEDQIPKLVEYLVSQNAIDPTSLSVKEAQEEGPSLAGDKGDTEHGQAVYEMYCANCHGSKGKGDGPVGQALVPPAADLTTTKKKSDPDLLDAIQNGKPGTAMPPWKGDLSAQDIQDVLSYIKSFSQ